MFKNIHVLVSANTAQLKTKLAGAARDVGVFEKQVEGSNARLGKMSKLAGAAGVALGATLAVGLAKSITLAAEFEKGMRNANSIMQLSEEEFRAVSDEVLDLSTRVPQAATVLADGLYNVASSGYVGADGLTVLEESAVAAAAGLTTTDVSAKAITSVLNAYGREAEEAGDVSDTLFKTVELGVLTFEDLAGNLGDVIGLAAAAGVEIDQVSAATATMTKAGIGTAQATTSLNRVIQGIIDPSDKLAATFKEWGYETGQLALDHLGLEGVIQKVREETGGQATAVLEYFTEIRGARGVLGLMIDDGKTYADVTDQITDSQKRAGATAAAFKEQQKALTAQWDLFVSGVQSGLIQTGRTLTPFLSDMLGGFNELSGILGRTVPEAFQRLKPFLSSVGNLLGSLWQLFQKVGSAAAPIAGILIGIVTGPVIMGLTGLLNVVADVVGWLADSEEALAAVAAVGALALAPTLATLITRMQVMATMGLVNVVSGIATALTGAAGAATALQVALGPVGIALAAAAAAFVYLKGRGDAAAESYRTAADAAASFSDVDFSAPDSAEFDEAITDMRNTLATLGEEASRGYLIQVAIEDVRSGAAPTEALKNIEIIAKQVFGQDYELGVDASDLLDLDVELDAIQTQLSGLSRDISEEWGGVWKDIGGLAKEQLREVADGAAQAFASGDWDVALRQIAAAEEALHDMDIPAGALHHSLGFLSDEFAKNLQLQEFSLIASQDLTSALEQMADGVTNVTDGEREFAQAVLEATEAGMGLDEAIQSVAGDYPALARATQEVTGEQGEQLQVLNDLESQYAAVQQELQNYLDAQRAMFDPLFAAQEATLALSDAQKAEADALKELKLAKAGDKEASMSVEEAERNLEDARRDGIKAAMDQEGALYDLKVAVDSGDVSVSQARETLDRWVEQGWISKEAADQFAGSVRGLTGDAEKWASRTYNAEVTADTEQAKIGLSNITSSLQNLVSRSWTATIGVTGIRSALSAFREADGGVLSFYANGGVNEDHVAQIAPAGAMRVWAEPETGGEAYIPLTPSKRVRSTAVLEEVANRFGMALVEQQRGRGRDGSTIIENLNLRAYNDRFELTQVQDEIAFREAL